jgi:hypothetical protein
MTSEREWACYPTVPGVAIAQLSRREGIDAVLVTPWRWDGTARTREPRVVPHVPGQAIAHATAAAQPSLLDGE